MITAVYIKSHDVIGLSITGHADSGPYGQDIVCAAVSGIIESLRIYMTRCPYCIVHDADGVLTMASTLIYEPAFDSAFAGLLALSSQYPQSVIAIVRPFGKDNKSNP